MDFYGHLFNTEAEAQQAINVINQTLGIPSVQDATTQTYTKYEVIANKIFIITDDTITNILGQAQLITVELPTETTHL